MMADDVAFVEAADVYEQTAFDHGAEYGADMSSERRRDDTAKEVRAARLALLDAHAAEVQAARAEGRAGALAEIDAACDELADLDEFEAVALWRVAPDRWRAEATASAESTAIGIGLTATNAILDLADCARAVAAPTWPDDEGEGL